MQKFWAKVLLGYSLYSNCNQEGNIQTTYIAG